AKEAGYDGVEIMGSEGYLINQFIVSRTNHREDKWGGEYSNRIQFPIEIVSQTRKAVGTDFIIIYRLSMLDLVDDGSTWEEVVVLAKEIERAGATIINTGIGWHEARIPTIGSMVPQGGFSWVTKRLMGAVSIPLITTNRINMPEIAESILSDGHADMVSMARPFLADPEFIVKTIEGRSNEINTCIACNQACLDHVFQLKVSSCIVNPRACHETILNYKKSIEKKKMAVVGAGPAGMAAATVLGMRGYHVDLFESSDKIGGQFNMAKIIPGKEDYAHTIRYYNSMIVKYGINLKLNSRATVDQLVDGNYDEIIVCTGVNPREIKIKGFQHPSILNYADVLERKVKVGKKVAIIGAGGIGYDVAEFLSQKTNAGSIPKFMEEWGVDMAYNSRGAIRNQVDNNISNRKIYLLKRSGGKFGKSLGKTTGWIHRASLNKKGVIQIANVEYLEIDKEGFHINANGKKMILPVDNVIVCAGQVSDSKLYDELKLKMSNVHIIGGAKLASQLDAKRAIKEASELASKL
ncbi:MAG: FAD-dependent oxidoreductase, partial [Saprospiraceae bacterium]